MWSRVEPAALHRAHGDLLQRGELDVDAKAVNRPSTMTGFRRISAVVALAAGMLLGVVVPVGQPRAEGEPAQPAYVGAPYFAPGAVYTQNFPDPSILFDPGTDLYYAYGTTTGGVNVPVMTSPDAVTWTARSRHATPNPNGEYHDGLPDPSPPGWPWQSGDARFPDDLWAPGSPSWAAVG